MKFIIKICLTIGLLVLTCAVFAKDSFELKIEIPPLQENFTIPINPTLQL